MFFPEIPACKIIKGFRALPIYDTLFNEFEVFFKDFFNICSRIGEFNAMNVSFAKSKLIEKFPGGDYQTNVRLFDPSDDNIFNITVLSTLANNI